MGGQGDGAGPLGEALPRGASDYELPSFLSQISKALIFIGGKSGKYKMPIKTKKFL